MGGLLQTVILRHRKENLKKCSLCGLESREDMLFLTYPKAKLPPMNGFILLSMTGPVLSKADQGHGLFLIDATWRYAEVMERFVDQAEIPLIKRSLPHNWRTAYPRTQQDCVDPQRGLASVEALYVAYLLMGRDTTGLFDHYYWKDRFFELN